MPRTEPYGASAPSRCAPGAAHADGAWPCTAGAGSACAGELSTEGKALATLQARAALVRCALYQQPSGGYLLTRTGWGLSRELGSLHEVSRVLAMIEGN